MNELKEAAERIERHEAAALTERGTEIPEYLSDQHSLVRDWSVTSAAYRKLADPTPLTPDVLKRVGFIDNILHDEYGDPVIEFAGNELIVFGATVPSNDPPTMGQLRCLCMGLNIHLDE